MAEGPLQIEFQRTGGFAGTVLATSVDAGDLPQAEEQGLRQLVDRADLPSLAQRSADRGAGRPDRFQYDLTVTLADRRFQVTVHEPDVPENLKPLIDRLNDLARRR